MIAIRRRIAAGLLVSGLGWAAVAESVVVITPHPEEIRREFQEAFSNWHRRLYGVVADLEWRDPGGSGEAQG